MALNSVTALTTVQNFSEHLGIPVPTPGSAEERVMERLIAAASSAIEAFLGRPLGYIAFITDVVRGLGWSKIQLTRTPIQMLQNVWLSGFTGPALTGDDYIIEDRGLTGIIDLRCTSPWTGRLGPGIAANALPDTERQDPECIIVEYDGGWVLPGQTGAPVFAAKLPADIELAAIITAEDAWLRRGSSRSVKTERLMSHSVSYAESSSGGSMADGSTIMLPAGLPADAGGLLAPYRRLAQW